MNSRETIIKELRETCSTLAQKITAQDGLIAELSARVTFYEEQHHLFLLRQFGRSSEQSPAGQEALLFNEAETFAAPQEPEPTTETVAAPRVTRKSGQRKEQVANLDIREKEHPATEEQEICTCCGEKMHFVKWEVREEVEFEPAKVVLMQHKQPIYACTPCQEAGEDAPIKTIKTMPKPAFLGSLASASLVSHIIIQKFVMSAPLYRQEHNMEGLGVQFSRQTMCNWILRAATLMQPLYDHMHQRLLSLDIAHADETPVQVLREPGRAATTDSTMWVYRSGRDGPSIVLYDYQTTRAGKHPRDFLKGFGGYDPVSENIARKKYLHVDGYEAYASVPFPVLINGGIVSDVILVGCWAHARRKFDEAAKVVKPADRKAGKRLLADEGLAHCNALYALEREFKDLTHQQRFEARIDRSQKKLVEIKKWLDAASVDVLPKSTTGQAIGYCINQWGKLTAFLQDARLEIDNNRAERTVKPFVIGRKNWLFANTPGGASASAMLYSIIESAKENNLIPYQYVKYLLQQLPNINPKNPREIEALMPWAPELPNDCHKK